jgi:hypothetical protein
VLDIDFNPILWYNNELMKEGVLWKIMKR